MTGIPINLRDQFIKHQGIAMLVAVVLVVDQYTKYLITRFLVPGQSIPTTGTFRISHITNTGSAFGLFPNQTIFLIVASIVGITILMLFYRTHPSPGPLLKTSLGLQLGGAIGNLADRVVFGYVVDFVTLGWWPSFNVADASIVTGILILVFVMLRSEQRVRRMQPTTLPGLLDPPQPNDWFYE